MATARDIMTASVTCIGEHETLAVAAQHMRDLNVGALPIRGDDERLQGMITDRDLVTKCLADGLDPSITTAGQLAQGSIYCVDADASVEAMLDIMEEHQIRRLPVVEKDCPVGIVAEADIVRQLPEYTVVRFARAISSPKALTRH
jgi:CBS domain-containing protein